MVWACNLNYFIMRFKNTEMPSAWFPRYAMHSNTAVEFCSIHQLPTESVS